MSEKTKPRLISFKLCPYVQRAVIMLEEKKVPFDITYIDLRDKPDWFLEISPLGKVPVLEVEETVLFESAVIAEYLDEVHPPSLHPLDPLKKALNRAWIEFSSELLIDLYRMVLADNERDFDQSRAAVREKLERLEKQLKEGPFFNGQGFALVDAAFAPAFMRIGLMEEFLPLGLLRDLPKVIRWKEALLDREAVKVSVVAEFPDLFRASIVQRDGILARRAQVGREAGA
jgi:glutathione S-transferase